MFKKTKLNSDHFLSPVIPTASIKNLKDYMLSYYGKDRFGRKPTCAVCFDMSGTGKTTTIMEASLQSQSTLVHVSLIDNHIFTSMFDSCKNMAKRLDPPLKSTDFMLIDEVESYFKIRFQAALIQLFQAINTKLYSVGAQSLLHLKLPMYSSPNERDSRHLQSIYNSLVERVTNLGRLLVIHLDDCQEFFCGITQEPKIRSNSVQVGHIMGLALRYFSKLISQLPTSNTILWIFSGTRPNLKLEMKVASKFENPFDISKYLTDFNLQDIFTVLSNYFCVENTPSLQNKMQQLCGPPKLLKFFIESAEHVPLQSMHDLIENWDEIEDRAVIEYKEQIITTINHLKHECQLGLYARNLTLLHTCALISGKVLQFDHLPLDWMPLIEAGLVRIKDIGGGKFNLYEPNRFLIKIFAGYIQWFTWENIQNLVANIKAASTSTNLKGKVFEFLFALNLCGLPNNTLWRTLKDKMNIYQNMDWNPAIEIMEHVDDCIDKNAVYVMKDPDYRKLKTDVVFFARSKDTDETVRVLCQLTVQGKCGTTKVDDSLQAMCNIRSIENYQDLRVFFAPRSNIVMNAVYKENYEANNCFFFDIQNERILDFPFEFCDPEKSQEALMALTNMDHQDFESAQTIQTFKKKRKLDNMQEFYDALGNLPECEISDIETIRAAFESHRIGFSDLATLNDDDLRDCGLHQLGLRKKIRLILETIQ